MIPLLVANWKMHKTRSEALAFVEEVRRLWPRERSLEATIAPPFTALEAVGHALRNTPLTLAAQNVHWEEEGAHTGEIAARFLSDLGCRYVIVGHSERRNQWGETDEQVNNKVKAILTHGMTPILCLGESLRDRDGGRILEVIGVQLAGGLRGVAALLAGAGSRLVIAYEPVWAVGTGRVAEPRQVREVHGALRQWLVDQLGAPGAAQVRLLYGGSVTPENVGEMAAEPDVDGALVGGASLDAKQFVMLAQRITERRSS